MPKKLALDKLFDELLHAHESLELDNISESAASGYSEKQLKVNLQTYIARARRRYKYAVRILLRENERNSIRKLFDR